MSQVDPEHTPSSKSPEQDRSSFTDTFRELLPGVEFEESADLHEARMAAQEALLGGDSEPDFLRSVWGEYANVCEQAIDSKAQEDTSARLQIAGLLHKALIFREVGNVERYREELTDAREYAFNMYFDEIVEAIDRELDSL